MACREKPVRNHVRRTLPDGVKMRHDTKFRTVSCLDDPDYRGGSKSRHQNPAHDLPARKRENATPRYETERLATLRLSSNRGHIRTLPTNPIVHRGRNSWRNRGVCQCRSSLVRGPSRLKIDKGSACSQLAIRHTWRKKLGIRNSPSTARLSPYRTTAHRMREPEYPCNRAPPPSSLWRTGC